MEITLKPYHIIITTLAFFAVKPYLSKDFLNIHSEKTVYEEIITYKPVVHEDMKCPADLYDVVQHFMADAEKHGVSSDRIFNLDAINIRSENDDTWGETDLHVKNGYLHGEINIRENILDDSIGTYWVVYHELGHWYGLEHSDLMMSEGYSEEIGQIITPEKWDLLVDDLFDKIKALGEVRTK